MKHFFSTRAPLAFAAFFAAAAIVSCDDDPIGPPAAPAAIAASTTPPATAEVATAVQGPAVIATNADGSPAAGVVVDFDVTGGGGALQFSTVTTDASGVASSGFWQIGPAVGVNTATATATGLTPVTFTLTSVPGAASRISITAGNLQSGSPGSTLTTPLSIRVSDAGGNAKAGETVTFTVLTGGGSVAGATATTNAQGIATSGAWTLGSCPQSIQTTRAASGTLQTTFTSSSRTPIAVGATVDGALEATDCSINGAFADQYELATPSAAMSISLASSAFDAVVNVSDSAGGVLSLSNDNDPAGGTNAAIWLITVPGMHTITATSATAGATGAYTLGITSVSASVTDCTTPFIEIGATTQQTLTTADCTTHNGVNADAYFVFLTAGVQVVIRQSSNPLDALIELYAPDGSLLVQRDILGVSSNSETITFTPTTTGIYKIVATSYGLVFDDAYGAEYGNYVFSVLRQ